MMSYYQFSTNNYKLEIDALNDELKALEEGLAI